MRHTAGAPRPRRQSPLRGDKLGGRHGHCTKLYRPRGEAESRIKEARIDLSVRRASCHKSAANQLRLLLAALACALMIHLRRLTLKVTELERACADMIRPKLAKTGAAVIRNTRRVRPLLASNHPLKHVILTATRALAP